MLTPITTATARTAGTEGKPGVVSWLLAPSPFGGRGPGKVFARRSRAVKSLRIPNLFTGNA